MAGWKTDTYALADYLEQFSPFHTEARVQCETCGSTGWVLCAPNGEETECRACVVGVDDEAMHGFVSIKIGEVELKQVQDICEPYRPKQEYALIDFMDAHPGIDSESWLCIARPSE